MAIPAGTARLSFHGTLQGGQEIWQTSLWVVADAVSQAAADALAADGSAAWASAGMTTDLLTNQDTYTGCTAYVYTSGGGAADRVGTAPASTAGTGTTYNPLQVSYVVTLESSRAGRHGKGRMYLPNRKVQIDSTGLISGTNTTLLVTDAQQLIQALNARTPSTICVVVSQTLGDFADIVAVSGDQRLDIQRRRANRQSTGTRTRLSV